MEVVLFLDMISGEMTVTMEISLDFILLIICYLYLILIQMLKKESFTDTSIAQETLTDGVTSLILATYLLLMFLNSRQLQL
jgi:hypothetical protein